MPRGYYLVNSDIGLDEDDLHEFKSHRSIQNEEIPNWCLTQEGNKIKRSRQPVSKWVPQPNEFYGGKKWTAIFLIVFVIAERFVPFLIRGKEESSI